MYYCNDDKNLFYKFQAKIGQNDKNCNFYWFLIFFVRFWKLKQRFQRNRLVLNDLDKYVYLNTEKT